MIKPVLPLILILGTSIPALAEGSRQLDAHEHGVGALNIAFDGARVALELRAPGADIVGFEHAAESAEDRAAVAAAIEILSHPLDLFKLPVSAGCKLSSTRVVLEGDPHHHAHHDEEQHAHSAQEHGEYDHDEHGHNGDAHTHGDKEHDHEADGTGHEEHAHDYHEAGGDHQHGGHTEFHAEYVLDCADLAALSHMDFAYFSRFPNARELEVQMVGRSGAKGFEVVRDAPVLDLTGQR